MASPRLDCISFLLATLLVAGCNGLADLGGSCDVPGRPSANDGSGGSDRTDGTDGAVTSSGGTVTDPSALGGAAGNGGASPGKGGASGDATRDGGGAGGAPGGGGAPGAGGASTGGVAATGGAPPGAGGSSPEGGTSSGGTVGAGGAGNASCSNGVKDGDETDVDCGGPCDGCGPGDTCHADTDCSVFATGCDRCMCDQHTFTCVHDHCLDDKADVDETDVDCGGPRCSPCPNADSCRADSDCVSNACDLVTLRCITDQCADHRKDGAESDADCGGACGLCPVGKHCFSNVDCAPGHTCSSSHVCQ